MHGSDSLRPSTIRPGAAVPTRFVLRVVAVVALMVASIGLTPVASGATGDIGHEDQSFSGTSDPTGTKRAESVLWWNDGAWWADMWDTSSQDFHIFRLDLPSQTWIDAGTAIDTRANSHADVLWAGSHLYVASHLSVGSESAAVAGSPSYLYRFRYDSGSKSYTLDSGFPVLINNYKTETLVIDRDSTGNVWATWQQDNQIYVNRTLGGDDHSWGVPFALPVTGSSVTTDDSSAVVAFGGDSIGLMWSNQSSANDAMFFAVHLDGDPDTTWQASRTAIQGPNTADDHINLKSLQADGSGRVYAAVKTSFTKSAQPLIMLLVRNRSTGDWSSYPIARVSDCPNRPSVLIDEQNRVLHAFYSAPAPPGNACNSSGGAIDEKTSALDAIAFPVGAGTHVILDADSAYVHNASSTKQNVTSSTGIVVLARNSHTTRYWHHYEALPGSPPPPTPSPTASATSAATPTTSPSPSPTPSPSPSPSPSPTSTLSGNGIQRMSTSTVINGTASNLVAVNRPAGTAQGDVLVACLALNGGAVSGAPPGWSLLAAATAQSNPKVYGYYHVAGASEPSTYTWTLAGAVANGAGIARYGGVATGNPIDGAVSTATGAASTSAAVPGVTTSAGGSMLVGCLGINSSSTSVTIASPPGMTEAWDIGGKRHEQADQMLTNAGASGPRTWAFSASREWAGWLVALRD